MSKLIKTTLASAVALVLISCSPLASATDADAQPAKPAQAADVTMAQGFEGDWGGTLGGALRLVFHIAKSAKGEYSVVLESVDQGHGKIPVDKVQITSDRMALSIAAIHGTYEAKWNDADKTWSGTWSQGQPLPLTLQRVHGEPPKIRRPQEEAINSGALPYKHQIVSFDGAASHVKLSGTLTTPEGVGPFPAVVLVAGSGKHTRDEEVLGHKVFLVLADYLTRRGIAVLRYDKRGVGESKGDFQEATTNDFAADAEAAVAFLRSQHDIDPQHVGVIGHSEGGTIAPIVAAHDAKVSFIVLLAGTAIPGDKLLATQIYLIHKANGEPEEKIKAEREINEEIFAAAAGAANGAEAKSRAEAIFDKAKQEHKIPAEVDKSKAGLDGLNSAWLRQFLSYDPAPTLRKLTVPVLALNGSLDLQVPPKEDLDGMRSALSNNKDATIVELPKLNHLFQAAKTGAPSEYGVIEETINPAALKTIGDWVVAHTKQ